MPRGKQRKVVLARLGQDLVRIMLTKPDTFNCTASYFVEPRHQTATSRDKRTSTIP
jgi:hypothetical protein